MGNIDFGDPIGVRALFEQPFGMTNMLYLDHLGQNMYTCVYVDAGIARGGAALRSRFLSWGVPESMNATMIFGHSHSHNAIAFRLILCG
jgi:hypothetical protein